MSTQIPPPPIETVQGYVEPRTVFRELLDVIARAIDEHPRSQQKAIGASEVGHACAKRIGYKLAGTETLNRQPPPWRPTVGTAVHTWLEDVFEAENIHQGYHELGSGRWLTERRLLVGSIGGNLVHGTSDLFDVASGYSIDWKIVGRTTLRKAKAGHIDDPYRYQGHIYGRGRQALGQQVNGVMVAFLPSAGELAEAEFWAEPFDPGMAAKAFTRADGIASLIGSLPADDALRLLPKADAYCSHCPFFVAAGTGGLDGCPGAEGLSQRHPIGNSTTDLLVPALRDRAAI